MSIAEENFVGGMLPQTPISNPVITRNIAKEKTDVVDNINDDIDSVDTDIDDVDNEEDKKKKIVDIDDKKNTLDIDEYQEGSIEINTYPVPASVVLVSVAIIFTELINLLKIGIDKIGTPDAQSSYRKILREYHKIMIGKNAPNFDDLKKTRTYVKNNQAPTNEISGRLKKYGLGIDNFLVEYTTKKGEDVCHGYIKKRYVSLAWLSPDKQVVKGFTSKKFYSVTEKEYDKYSTYYNACIGVDNNVFTDEVHIFLVECSKICKKYEADLTKEINNVKVVDTMESKLENLQRQYNDAKMLYESTGESRYKTKMEGLEYFIAKEMSQADMKFVDQVTADTIAQLNTNIDRTKAEINQIDANLRQPRVDKLKLEQKYPKGVIPSPEDQAKISELTKKITALERDKITKTDACKEYERKLANWEERAQKQADTAKGTLNKPTYANSPVKVPMSTSRSRYAMSSVDDIVNDEHIEESSSDINGLFDFMFESTSSMIGFNEVVSNIPEIVDIGDIDFENVDETTVNELENLLK